MRKVKKYRGWTIYKDIEEDGFENYLAFLPDETPAEGFSAEWEGGSVKEMQDFIDSY